MNKVMNKNVKRMIAIACAGVIGLGVAASPVMAAAPEINTDVFYTTDSTNIDADGRVMMVIPAGVNMTKHNLTQEFDVTMKATNPNMNLPNNFSAEVTVASTNQGKLKMVGNPAEVNYELYKGEVAKGGMKIDISQQADHPFHTFTAQQDTGEVEQRAYVKIAQQDSEKLEKINQPGAQFKDTLTFKVTKVEGDGLVDPNKPKP